MKSILRSLITAFSIFLLGINVALAADADITVNGRVVAKPCTVATSTASVDLGDLYALNLKNAGSASDWKQVILELINCPIGTSNVTATFSGVIDSTGYYKNQGTSGNLQLQLQDDSGINLSNGKTKTLAVNDSTLSVRFPLQIRVLTVNGSATQGTIQTVINVIYTYA